MVVSVKSGVLHAFQPTLYSPSRQTRNAPCPNLGIQALSMNTKSMLQAMIGSCVAGENADGALFGFPLVNNKSIKSCKHDSHLFGSPIIKIAKTEINYFISTKCRICKLLQHMYKIPVFPQNTKTTKPQVNEKYYCISNSWNMNMELFK